jgi:muramidase (phage lysozyme)
MADSAVIKEFLVRLGFRIDKTGQQEFSNVLTAATTKALLLAEAMEKTASVVVNAVAQMSRALDDLYFSSQRTGATIEGISALGYAASRTGSSVGAARQSIEGFAAALRNNPGMASYLRALGVNPNQETTGAIQQLSSNLNQRFPGKQNFYLRRQFYAQAGIDEQFGMSLENGDFQRKVSEYNRIMARAGVDSEKAGKAAKYFWDQIERLGVAFTALDRKFTQEVGTKLGDQIGKFALLIENNFDKIVPVLERLAKGLIAAGEMTIKVLGDFVDMVRAVIDWFNKLDPASQNAIKWFTAIGAAITALNVIVKSGPLGAILALVAAVELLWDDFQAYKRGDDHVIDWDKWVPRIEKVTTAIGDVVTKVHELTKGFQGWQGVVEGALLYFTYTFVRSMIAGLVSIATQAGTTAAAVAGVGAGGTAGASAGLAGLLGRIGGLARLAGVAGISYLATKKYGEGNTSFAEDVHEQGFGGAWKRFMAQMRGQQGGDQQEKKEEQATESLQESSDKLLKSSQKLDKFSEAFANAFAEGATGGPGGAGPEAGGFFSKVAGFFRRGADTEAAANRYASGGGGGGGPADKAGDVVDTTLTPEARAFLNLTAAGESPGYNVLSGGGTFSDYSHHPGGRAAGRYQFIPSTWADVQKKLGLPDISPASQDKAAWYLAQRDYKRSTGRDLATDMKSDDPLVLSRIASGLKNTWVSFPGGSQSHISLGPWLDKLRAFRAREANRSVVRTGPDSPSAPSPALGGPTPQSQMFSNLVPFQAIPGTAGAELLQPQSRHSTVINVHGVSDPHQAANIVSRTQDEQHAMLARDLRTAVA